MKNYCHVCYIFNLKHNLNNNENNNKNTKYSIKQYQNKIENKIRKLNSNKLNDDDIMMSPKIPTNEKFSKQIDEDLHVD